MYRYNDGVVVWEGEDRAARVRLSWSGGDEPAVVDVVAACRSFSLDDLLSVCFKRLYLPLINQT